jgi:hypothetical protein
MPRALAIVRRNVEEVGEIDPVTRAKPKRIWFTLEALESFDAAEPVAELAERLKFQYRDYPVNSLSRFLSVTLDCDENSVVTARMREQTKGTGIQRIRAVKISEDGGEGSVRQIDLIYKLKMAIQEGQFVVDETRFGTAWREQLGRFDYATPWRPPDLNLGAAVALAFWHTEVHVTGWGEQPGRLVW